jgi:hypothetical protein
MRNRLSVTDFLTTFNFIDIILPFFEVYFKLYWFKQQTSNEIQSTPLAWNSSRQ